MFRRALPLALAAVVGLALARRASASQVVTFTDDDWAAISTSSDKLLVVKHYAPVRRALHYALCISN